MSAAEQGTGPGAGRDAGRSTVPGAGMTPVARSAPDDAPRTPGDTPSTPGPDRATTAPVPDDAASTPGTDRAAVGQGADGPAPPPAAETPEPVETTEPAETTEPVETTEPEAPEPAEQPGPTEPDGAVPEAADPEAADPEAAASPVVRRLRRGRDPLAAVLIGVLTLLLGFAFAVQVRSTDTDQQLAGAREEDLVRILDDLTAQQDRLRQEIADQRAALDQLGSSDSASAAALQEARSRAEALGILNGSVAAQGPGITMTVRDPDGRISSSVLLNAIEELRGAGAETMQVDGVRIGVSSAVTGSPGHLAIDGQDLAAPYTFVVIGSPQDMATAMSIPGGVESTVGGRGGSVEIVQSEQVVVDALRPLDVPQYADPTAGD